MHLEQKVTLELEALVQPGALHLRQELASAQGEGFRVEVAASVNGCVVVTYYPEGEGVPSGAWTSYCLTPKVLVEAVLALHQKEADDADAQA